MAEKSQKINFYISRKELSFEFFRSSGPGGQNINKVSSGARVRWHIQNNKYLNNEEKLKIQKKYPNKFTKEGDFIVEAEKFRSQIDNKNFALEKLKKFVISAIQEKERKMKIIIPPEKKEKRLNDKKIISQKKKLRKIHKEDLLEAF